ncbi:serine/threonine protein kinase [Minicystis rosea]|nr:serine/threonine protein kinase [Minicystis rosea]
MTCPSDAEILAFIDGSLSEEARSSTETHLDACPSCLAIVAALARTSDADRAPSRAAPGPLLSDGQPRYVPGAEIARGGMGRILIARDRLLNRTVALKLLRVHEEGLARRFRREQRITARLQHPAIVPIHDAGTLPDGTPFFAMRLVKGESLDRKAAKARSLAERLRLLPAVIGVVDAIAYAHDEGVVHRDLKPQNVLVGPFGEVVVVDWGLARERPGSKDDDLPRSPGPENKEGPSRAEEISKDGSERADPEATRAGEVLGTLAYMAPEQAQGRSADARSDVYGLGAILYHVLAGVPPHVGRPASLSTGAVFHAPEPVARRVPDVPPDLVAIVDRAMAPDPEARYATAAQLAEDLGRWQAGRLVEAHRYTPGDLLRRFARRYRAALLVAMTALVISTALGVVGLRRIFAERSRALAEQARAEAARGRAESQRVAAETLVSFVLGDLRGRLLRVGRLDALAGVARAVIDYQDGSPAAEDSATLLRRSDAAGLAGDVAFAIGNLDAAEESFQRSRKAADEAGTSESAAEARCRAALHLGDVRKRRGDLAAATSHYEECIAPAQSAQTPAFQELLVRRRIALAEVARIRNDLPASRRLLEEGGALAARLVDEAGGPRADVAHLLVTLHSDLWKTLNLAGEVKAERDVAIAALDLARARVDARPDDHGARYDLAVAQTQLGAAEDHGGDGAAAEQSYRQALSEHRLLAARDPSNTEWERAVGVVAERLGSLMLRRGDTKGALSWLRESDDASVRLVAIAPENLEWQRDLGVSALALGDALASLDRLDEARRETQRAVDVFKRLLEIRPDVGRSEHDLGIALSHLGEVEIKAHHVPLGQEEQRRGIEMLKRHLHTADTPQARHELAAALLVLAESEHGPEATRHIEEALAILAPIRALSGGNAELQELIAGADELLRKARSAR